MEKKTPLGAVIHQTASVVDSFIGNHISNINGCMITGVEGVTMGLIIGEQITSAHEIMEKTHVSKATASQTLNSLMKKGMITMISAKDDRRRKIINPTEKGIAVMELLEKNIDALNSKMENCFTEAEKEQFYLLLNKMRDHVIELAC